MRAVDVAVIGGGVIGAACARAAALRGLTVGIFEPGPGAAPDCRGALFAPEDGTVDPQALTRACLADARRLGAALIAERVEEVRRDGGRATGVVTAAGATAAEHVVVAAGAWSGGLRGLPRPLPVEPVRGQMAAVPWPGGPPAILYHDHGYVLARGGAALLGSTMERAGFDSRVTNEGLAQIFRGAVRLLPRLETQPVVRMWAGLRPGTPDGRPILGPDPDVERLWYATGHGRNGVLLASLTGEITGDLLARGETDVDIVALEVQRFQS